MDTKTKNNTFHIVLAVVAISLSFLSWRSVALAIESPQASNWLIPILLFSFTAVAVLLGIVVLRKYWYAVWLVFLTMLVSLAFALSYWHVVVIAVAMLFVNFGIVRMRSELRLRIKLEIIRSLRFGMVWLIFGYAMVISSVYYWQVVDKPYQQLLPQFTIGEGTSSLVGKTLSQVSPGFESLRNEDVTVNEFLLDIYESQQEKQEDSETTEPTSSSSIDSLAQSMGIALSPEEKNQLENALSTNQQTAEQTLFLAQGRDQIADILGRPVQGSEKMSAIFTEMINSRLEQSVTSESSTSQYGNVIPLILALLLFLALLPVGSLLQYVWLGLLSAIFWIFVRTGLIRIEKEQVEVERIR